MSLNFGKLNRAVAFNPTSAFPLDARCYFESLSDAEAAAASAQEAGSDKSSYYHGMTLVVVEGDKVKFYIITQNNTLSEVGKDPDGKSLSFKDGTEILTIHGYDAATKHQYLIKGDDGVEWIDIPTIPDADIEKLFAEVKE